MPIYTLNHELIFPDPAKVHRATGILAIGGDLRPERLLLAYAKGIFPWYDETETPILWHFPPLRMVLLPSELHVSRSLAKTLRQAPYEVRFDTAFEQVLAGCATTPRPGQNGTWLNDEMRAAYTALHRQGHAHCAEAWQGDRLVGGLYGVTLGGVFFGESMFAHAPDASKVAFVHTIRSLESFGYGLVDCQVHTDHLATFGATEWPSRAFQRALNEHLKRTPSQAWPCAPFRF